MRITIADLDTNLQGNLIQEYTKEQTEAIIIPLDILLKEAENNLDDLYDSFISVIYDLYANPSTLGGILRSDSVERICNELTKSHFSDMISSIEDDIRGGGTYDIEKLEEENMVFIFAVKEDQLHHIKVPDSYERAFIMKCKTEMNILIEENVYASTKKTWLENNK